MNSRHTTSRRRVVPVADRAEAPVVRVEAPVVRAAGRAARAADPAVRVVVPAVRVADLAVAPAATARSLPSPRNARIARPKHL